MSSLWQTVSENVVFVLEFLALIVVMFLMGNTGNGRPVTLHYSHGLRL